jgi:hypothetical protein
MSNFCGWPLIIIIRAIEVSDRRIDKFIDVHAVQAIDPNSIKLPAESGILSPTEGANSALSTKDMVDAVGLVINEVRFTCTQAEGICANDHTPKPRHRAHRAIAFEGAGAQVEIRLKANGPTMTMPRIRLFHGCKLAPRASKFVSCAFMIFDKSVVVDSALDERDGCIWDIDPKPSVEAMLYRVCRA